LSSFQFFRKVEQIVEQSVRPLLRADGGDLEIVDIKDELVYVKLAGACAGCIGAATTLKLMVERTLKEQVSERIRVVAV